MLKETFNITLRWQAGNNCFNVLCDLTLSLVEIMPIKGKKMVTCFFSAAWIIRLGINTLLRDVLIFFRLDKEWAIMIN